MLHKFYITVCNNYILQYLCKLFEPKKCPIKPFDHNGTVKWNNQMFDGESSQSVDKSKVSISGKCQFYKEFIVVSSLSHIEK